MPELTNDARRELLELSARLDAIASRLGGGERGDPAARDAAAQISAEAGRLRRVLDAVGKAEREAGESARAAIRDEPPLDDVVDELRRYR
jgi:hypothetical protein